MVRLFVSAKVAGEGRPTAVMGAIILQDAKHIKKPKKDTVRQRKGKKLTQVWAVSFCGSFGVIADRFPRRG